ncbi:AraC family transcriptional regulator [Cohnella nanjingensis]|uniref:AraC family transcriptional regulator n=1 Tax=Cohnella nanjingensis TaxID=1387779 RepID=A0A7X0RKG8_9BACL|nr:AraC family transcriptional regulator [Cohnella nanjingensis]MBB6669123.1 AraC family transcriptional regulator [Cohnella nanjingensis]
MEHERKMEGFDEERLFVLPDYMAGELSQSHLTRGLYVSDIGYFPRARHHYRERPEGSNAHILIYCVEGEGWVETNGKPAAVTERQLVAIPANVPHRYGASSDSPWSIYWVHLQGEYVADYMKLFGLDGGAVRLPAGAFSAWTDGFEKCYRLLSGKPYSMPAQVLVSLTMGELLGNVGMSAEGSARDRKRETDLAGAIRFLNDRLAESVSLAELAAHTGISKQHLVYLFNQETGFPPIEYFLRLKMQKAGQLLCLTGLTVKEIAAAVGIGDPYYFSRLFKKLMGASPAHYRSVPKG